MEEKTNYLAHHGVKGQKWGVRRYQNADGSLTAAGRKHNGYSMSKKQMKKAIKSAKRAERKRSGTWMSTGQNMNRTTENFNRAIDNDTKLNEARSRKKEAEDREIKFQNIIDESNDLKDYLTRLQNDPNASREARRRVEQTYLRSKERIKTSNAKEEIKRAQADYSKAYDDSVKRKLEIDKKYIEKYKEAALKDIGIEDIELGKRMLEEYGLVNKATRYLYRGMVVR